MQSRFGRFMGFFFGVLLLASYNKAFAACTPPPGSNSIVVENCLPGNPSSQWDISGTGDLTIQGFATDISVNQGGTVNFKIKTNANNYRLDIYRMGYYGGAGARKVGSVTHSGKQNQPACKTDSSTGLIDCGNWAVSASWTVPATATSGIYFAKVIRTDTGGASHIFFVVRNDSSHSDILFKTSDTTWQAYNDYGGANLYIGGPGPQGGAYKVSYNRPFHTRVYEFWSWVFNAEYPMVRFLEANGYDVSYFTGVDADRFGSLILQHKLLLSVGHDEYWSGNERANVEAARAAGIHLAFITGNGIFWKTRWENSIAGTNTPYRTLVCYKETHANTAIDPLDPPISTATWRDPRFGPLPAGNGADGGRPENGLQGTIYWVNGLNSNQEIKVPPSDGKMRFWRNTGVASLAASGQTYVTQFNPLVYEWDIDADNGFRPAGLFDLSTATYNTNDKYLLDYGSTYGAGTATHHLTMYRYLCSKSPCINPSALVFGAGTTQWPWGLDGNHDDPNNSSTISSNTPDPNLQQATINLFADMGVQPTTLQANLKAAAQATDAIPPSSAITTPATGSNVTLGSTVNITGTAADTGGTGDANDPKGVVGGVEVSVDGGSTWHPATGRETWSYSWTPSTLGTMTIKSRAVDDSGNLETPSTSVAVTISACSNCYTIWPNTVTPLKADEGPDSPVELGVKFRSDVDGYITGIRFYKADTNTGTHVGTLWSITGQQMAQAAFSAETASGWQQVNFATPMAITANTFYMASYHTDTGHYADDQNYFTTQGVDSPPLHALQSGVSGFNGVYSYGPAGTFPQTNYNSSNYWVDVVFTPK